MYKFNLVDRTIKTIFIIAIFVLVISLPSYILIRSDNDNEDTKNHLSITTEEAIPIAEKSYLLKGTLTLPEDYSDLQVHFEYYNKDYALWHTPISLEKYVIDDAIEEGDGLSAADIDNDGEIDPIVGTGKGGSVYWYEKINPFNWKKHLIVKDLVEVEGTSAADIDSDGKIEVFILDQATDDPDAPNVYIAKQKFNDPAGEWSLSVLDQHAPHVQQGLIFDVDGDEDLDFVYAYEGRIDGEGGFYWLENNGRDVLDLKNWEKHEIDQIEGAWWIDCKSPKDWGGYGTGDIAVGVRAGSRSPPSANGGIYIYTQPADPTTRWNRITVDDSHPVLQVVSGNFAGDPMGRDLAAGACHDSDDEGLYIYYYDEFWGKIHLRSDHDWWGTYGYDINQDGYDDIISGDRTDGTLDIFVHSTYPRYSLRTTIPYLKPDDRMIFADIDGDGLEAEFFLGSDSESILAWFDTLDIKISSTGSQPAEGEFQYMLDNLRRNNTYNFRAVAVGPDNFRIEGDWLSFTTG